MDAFLISITVFVLAVFVGFEVITKIPSTLHNATDVWIERDFRHYDRGRAGGCGLGLERGGQVLGLGCGGARNR